MKTIYYSKKLQIEITDDEFVEVMKEFDKDNIAFLSRLNLILFPNYLWAGQRPNIKN